MAEEGLNSGFLIPCPRRLYQLKVILVWMECLPTSGLIMLWTVPTDPQAVQSKQSKQTILKALLT